jgi:pilus assembly protein FimV
LAVLLLSVAPVAGAAGLGKLVVLSAMGEPLRAEIDLPGTTRHVNEHPALTPRLASPAIYPMVGFRYNPVLAGASLNIRRHADGGNVIEIVSARPVSEPFIHLLVELESDTMRMVRGYTVLLDPHGYRSPRGAAAVEFPPEMIPAAVSVTAPAAAPAVSFTPRRKPVPGLRAGPARSAAAQPDTTAKTLADMLERVAALEVAVAQLQRKLEMPDAGQKPAAGKSSAHQPVEPKQVPAAVSAPPAAVPAKPVMPVESTLRHASAQDSLLNDALLVLAVGLLLLLGGLVWVMWGRPSAKA